MSTARGLRMGAALLWTSLCVAQAPTPARKLTLAEAEQIAIKNHPRIRAAKLTALAAEAVTTQVRAAYYPTLSGNLTAVGAAPNTAVSAGNVTTSSLFSRAASGIVVNQLLTDFGRTSNLEKSAQLKAQAQNENAGDVHAQILLQVHSAYYQALSAQAVLKVARETVAARQVSLRQVSELARNQLKSSLDVSFAEVYLSEAELLLFRAENEIEAALTNLSAAMGYASTQSFELTDEPMPAPLDPNPESEVKKALVSRPDLASARLQRDAAVKLAQGERRLAFPTISALGVAGLIPAREEKLHSRYAGAGVNMSIPVFNGGLFSARRNEAELKAQAAAGELSDLELRVARDVKVAWLNANNAFRQLAVTTRLQEQASRSMRLAQSRYELGLSSIVEITQAQLNKTDAEITNARAGYQYQIQRAILDFQIGALRR